MGRARGDLRQMGRGIKTRDGTSNKLSTMCVMDKYPVALCSKGPLDAVRGGTKMSQSCATRGILKDALEGADDE